MEGGRYLVRLCISRPYFFFLCSFFFSPSIQFDLGHQAIGDVIRIDERESTEFILINGPNNFVVYGRQDRVFLGEFTVKVEGVSSVFLHQTQDITRQ